MTFIDDKINALSPADRARVDHHYMGICQDETGLIRRGFDPDDYSPSLVLWTAYREVIEKDYSRLKDGMKSS
jgi:hypothetical protein